MQFSRKSFSNLAALESGDDSMAELQGGGPLSFGEDDGKESQASLDSEAGRRMKRYGNDTDLHALFDTDTLMHVR